MDKFIQFAVNHWPLVSLLLVLVTLLIITEQRKGGKGLSPQQAALLINHDDAVVVDVRDKTEFQAGHIVNATNIPFASFKDRLGQLEKHKKKPIIIVCKMGQHASMIGKQLNSAGFENVTRISGGMTEWRNCNLPVVTSSK